MSELSQPLKTILQQVLENDFIPLLPPLINQNEPVEKQQTKNLSRAFAAFALHKVCGISPELASKSVVDDFDDYGLDAIFYHAQTETLYFVQSKFKGSGGIGQGDSLKFCNGMRKIIKQDFAGFNRHVLVRDVEIKGALRDCEKIEMIIAHTGADIDRHAGEDFDNFTTDDTHGEVRLSEKIINFNGEKVSNALQNAQAYERVDTTLFVEGWSSISNPRPTHFGLIKLADLIELHKQKSEKLYQRNIRVFLGHKTDVNVSIRQTLSEKPQDFVYLNNGITALCQEIQPRDQIGTGKNLKITGISIINGAQTIGSSAKFIDDNRDTDISEAKVLITLIKAEPDSDFGDLVTRARNHQNKVLLSDFVALDEEQERLRREIAYLNLDYVYKASGANRRNDDSQIYVDEAAQSLPALQKDFRLAVLLKRKPIQLLDRDSEEYRFLFGSSVTAFQLVNAVRFNRYVQKQMTNAANSAADERERSIYRNGNYIVAWILAKRIINDINAATLIDETQFGAKLGGYFDELRQLLSEEVSGILPENMSPANFFKNQAFVNSLMRTMLNKYLNLNIDANEPLRRIEERNPDRFIEHLATLAPQIKLND